MTTAEIQQARLDYMARKQAELDAATPEAPSFQPTSPTNNFYKVCTE